MRLIDYLRSVRHTLSANRLRAALTLLGTVIGSASIVLLAGVLRSGEDMLVYSAQQATEADLITVRQNDVGFAASRIKLLRALGRGDEPVIEGSPLLPGVRVSSESQRELVAEPITDGPRRSDIPHDFHVRFVSASDATVQLYRLQIAKGRGLSAEDMAAMTRVCVVGSDVWNKLFGDEVPLSDQRLRIDGHQWTIVGVLKRKPMLGGGGENETWMWNRKVLIPQTTFDTMFRPDHSVDRLYVRLASARELKSKLKVAEWLVHEILMRRHGIENFKIEAQNASEGQTQLIMSIIKGLLLSTALLSLFVGGINIMNIMLVTVTERTREIGIRRALGAPPRSIWIQFLLEATFIAAVGGLVGVATGIGLTWITARAVSSGGNFAFHVETWSVVLGVVLSMGTGVVFGLFPAVRASRLDPVEALRFE